ncbi:hypothetical protein F53441_10289 [Fusarium austroafricanum]|uniref:Uncharacterized protein n=1 Tax=Fusarium austroafricanum TaxID=2364996 RepID=A0A8H4K9U1_9HYPO|nr:hypothetical protein F53441_10289 [Fusarium austroafricanum]
MPTAQGIAIRNGANRITLVFVIDDLQVTFSAAINPPIQPFSVNDATITYNSLDDLTSTHSISGQIGPETFSLSFDNGVTAEGNLSPPGVSPASTVHGSGSWEQN